VCWKARRVVILGEKTQPPPQPTNCQIRASNQKSPGGFCSNKKVGISQHTQSTKRQMWDRDPDRSGKSQLIVDRGGMLLED
jgi:hypothetical protein